jgi:hypothetical protein
MGMTRYSAAGPLLTGAHVALLRTAEPDVRCWASEAAEGGERASLRASEASEVGPKARIQVASRRRRRRVANCVTHSRQAVAQQQCFEARSILAQKDQPSSWLGIRPLEA